MFDQAVAGGDGGKGFAGTRRGLDEGARSSFGEGTLEADDGADLVFAQSVGVDGGQRFKPLSKRVGLLEQV